MIIPSFEEIQDKDIYELFDIWSTNHDELLSIINAHGIKDVFFHGTPHERFDRIQSTSRFNGDLLGIRRANRQVANDIVSSEYLYELYNAVLFCSGYGRQAGDFDPNNSNGSLLIFKNIGSISIAYSNTEDIIRNIRGIVGIEGYDDSITLSTIQDMGGRPSIFSRFPEFSTDLPNPEFTLVDAINLDLCDLYPSRGIFRIENYPLKQLLLRFITQEIVQKVFDRVYA